MSPQQWLAAIRDIAILGGIIAILVVVYRGGEDRVKAADLKALQTQITAQAQIVKSWKTEATDAQAQLTTQVARIDDAARHPVVHRWVRDESCAKPSVLPATAVQAGNALSDAGRIRPGDGADASPDPRDEIVARYKQRWKTVLAECRALDAQWPK